MSLSPQDVLVYFMVLTAAADQAMSEEELSRISSLVSRLPVFDGYDTTRLSDVADDCISLMHSTGDLEKVLDVMLEALPNRLQDTAYALAVEIAAVDLELPQEELRWLEMIRDRMDVERLVTAAIERAAKARLRRA